MPEKNESEDLIIAGAVIAVGYFGIIKPILKTLGVDSASQNTVDVQSVLPDAQNPFSVNFGIAYASENNGAYNVNGVNNGTYLDYATQSKAFIASSANDLSVLQGVPYAALADQIYSAINWYNVDADTVVSCFNQVTYQYEVSQMAQLISAVYGYDLYTLLRDGVSWISFVKVGIGATNLANIINHIKTLPVFSQSNPVYM